MIIDGALQFTGTAGTISNDSPTTGTQTSTNVLDLLNGRDLGVDTRLELLIQVMTTFAGGTSLRVDLQGAPNNAGVPGTYVTMWSSPVIVEADLVAGRYISNIELPRILLPTPQDPSAAMGLPRFLRLQYVTVGTHSAGAIYAAIVLDRQDYINYPPGIAITN